MAERSDKITGWLVPWEGRLVSRDGALRLGLTAADLERLREPAQWAGAAEALAQAAGAGDQIELSIPEDAERVMDVAVNELVRQGLRFLQLGYEKDRAGRAAFIAQFLPPPEQRPAGWVLRQPATGQTWDLPPGKKVVLGRGDDCDIRVPSAQASVRHCSIGFVRRAFALLDLRSTAGTFLDNLPMSRGIIEEFGLVCLGRKEMGHYLEMELRVPPGASAFLHVLNGSQAGEMIPLLHPQMTIGRAPHCDLQIDVPFVSREHLRIAMLTDCYLLTDLVSTNGTQLNNRPVQGGRLVAGDRIEIGGEVFEFLSRDSLDGFCLPGWRWRMGGGEGSLDRPLTTLGRDSNCEFAVQAAALSRRHARLVWERPGRLMLYDLASFGGVSVEGKLVAEAELHGGEQIRLGQVEAHVFSPE